MLSTVARNERSASLFVTKAQRHKWANAPKGSAFLYARPDVQELFEPLIVGHGWFPDKKSEKPLIDYVEQFGTRDPTAFLAVPAAID
jgi:isopenicillin-N epimerase